MASVDNVLDYLKKRVLPIPKPAHDPNSAFFESCRSCTTHYKDKLTHVRICCKHQTVEQQLKTNANGKVRHLRTVSVAGHAPCHFVAKGANKCQSYDRNPNKPLQKRKV